MNHSLKLFDGVFIIPVLQVFWMFFTILGGYLVYLHPRCIFDRLCFRSQTSHHTRVSRLIGGPFPPQKDGFIFFQEYRGYDVATLLGFVR